MLKKARMVTDNKNMTQMFDNQYCFVLTVEGMEISEIEKLFREEDGELE